MTLIARSVLNFGLETLRQSALIMETLTPMAETRLSWRELQNKLEAFICFSDPDELGGRSLNPYSRLWMTEGAGYLRAESAVTRRSSEESLIPLHTGMGLAFASRMMQAASPLPERIAMFVELCDRHAQPGYNGACYEALGLVARNLYPESIPFCERHLPENLRSYFWHGVGRGLYFIPTNLPPTASAPWRSVRMAQCEPPDQRSRLNAMSGLVWAITLVNIRHPEILELFRRHHAEDLPSAYEDGVRSALRVWEYSTSVAVREDASPGEWFHYGNK